MKEHRTMVDENSYWQLSFEFRLWSCEKVKVREHSSNKRVFPCRDVVCSLKWHLVVMMKQMRLSALDPLR